MRNFFTILLSNDNDNTITELIREKKTEVNIFHLNQHSELINENSVFFICIGGDKGKAESWWLKNDEDILNKGLKFIASLVDKPSQYDPNDKKNYKIRVKIEHTFFKPIKKEDYIYWPDSYDTDASVATKGKQTQAIGLLKEEKKYIGLLRGAMYYDNTLEEFYKSFFDSDFLNKIKASTKRFVEKSLSFSEELQLPKIDSNEKITSNYEKNFSQIIYYGVPGSGKSHRINEETKALPDEQKMRVVFHPEYTNADFIGQILPVLEDTGVRYAFKSGVFTKILIEALKNPSKSYYLIIEEINRGNAAAIFGEIFQLLDRGNDGWSSYCIMNDDINYEIRKSAPELNWTENTGIRLPPNLSLLATMNTSDQNVFTLDNAFQRRWDMKLVENKFEGNEAESQRNAEIGGSEVTWEQFQAHINKKIGEISSSMGMSSMEDKRLGCWFVKAEDGKIAKDKFAEKVLKYLWDDAFKFSREEIFEIKNKTSSLESIVSDFKNGDESAPCNWTIFKDTSFVPQQDNMQSESDAGETE